MVKSERREERQRMVDYQLRRRGIHDERVLAAMLRVPRHCFVSAEYQAQAYGDHALPVGPEQTLSQPYIVALMSEALELTGSEKVLEIGTGTGYQTAILAELAGSVYTIELSEPLSELAASRLTSMGYRGVHFRSGDGRHGWPEAAPFDAIVVTAAPKDIPENLVAQLRPQGLLVIPVGEESSQRLERHQKAADGLRADPPPIRDLGSVRFVTLR